MPIKINKIPVIFVNVSRFTLSEMNLPKYIVIIETKLNAIITPIKTIKPLYLVANNPAAICVLSPHSETKTRIKPE